MLQPNLFCDSAPTKILTRRELKDRDWRRKSDLAYQATSENWKDATYRIFVEQFLPTVNEPFIFERFTIFYNERAKIFGLPLTVKHQAWAGLTFLLVKNRKIEKLFDDAGKPMTDYRTNHNLSQLYRKV